MDMVQIVGGIIFLALVAGAFVISWFQFREKGYLFNNAYFWASQEERRRMDESKKSKKPYYQQSGIAFMLMGIFCLIFSAYIVTESVWMLAAFWLAVILAVVYAVVSSVKIERRQQLK